MGWIWLGQQNLMDNIRQNYINLAHMWPQSGKTWWSLGCPAVQVTTRERNGVRGGDETLKRRVAAKFAEGDLSGAVRELSEVKRGLQTEH